MATYPRSRLEEYDREIAAAVDEAASALGDELLELLALFRAAQSEDERAVWRTALAEAYWEAVSDAQDVAHALADELWRESALEEGVASKGPAAHEAIRRDEAAARVRSVAACMFRERNRWDDEQVLANLRASARASVEAAPNAAMEENIARGSRSRADLRYARVPTGPEACGFCFMVSSLGFAYSKKGRSPDHPNHPNCRCRVVPGFEGQTEVEGFDFAGMQKRWDRCAETVSAQTEGLGTRERDKLIAAECETRDPGWLWFGEEPEMGYDPEWVDYERDTADMLRAHGFSVEPVRRSMSERRPDFLLCGVAWEMKHPKNPGYLPVWNQFKKAVCGKSLKVRNPQSSLLVISNARSGESVDDIAAHVLDVANDEKDTFPEIEEVLIVSKNKTRRIKR